MPIAFTRAVSPWLAGCELTHLPRQPIDVALAREQHRRYEACLGELGCEVRRLPEAPDLPDAVFVEDTAVVLDEIAVVARPGAASRRGETFSVAIALSALRPLAWIEEPATLDGGDVLAVGRVLYVGLSGRTDAGGIAQLAAAVRPWGYDVRPVAVADCLHLKTAATRIGAATLLLQPAWVDAASFAGLEIVEVDAAEPMAANVLLVGDALVCSSAFPRTRERLERRGLRVHTVETTELAKAEGGVTCCSLVVPTGPPPAARRAGGDAFP